MKVWFLVVAALSALAGADQCKGVKALTTTTTTTAVTDEQCAEKCASALTQCKASNKETKELVKCITGALPNTCQLSSTVVVKKQTPWYKAKWFIALMSVLGVLAVLGAIYHLMGHPGIGGGDTNARTVVEPTNLEEDRERLM
ncbi:putative transmembrane protein [Gregarina niphandrodes]|uniref:Transmembrane protein n=1 Tax=Gregarina niphandrodes TaxID=110365 RepID=A0A023B3N3_GRENI|nr:putative transmembrane protein [Gregarina niphandrodes]EZG55656.1 putative transmembrane protein [Gregarina niphandrodes]|eukprot:XP_011131475.1 putative transmembrane protein [Gregarina niphandrodes]